MINPMRVAGYSIWLAVEIVKGALAVAQDAVLPGVDMQPAILELPLRCSTDLEISVMASSITITPGTITVGIASAAGQTPPTLYVHAIYADRPEEVRAALRDMEDHVLRMTRGPGWERRAS
ncbi:Na+/H+ antiporter subunit E [Ornithinimicrobium cerasi]|uniref:Multicomponent Na+:H+ antiporter subunit E n=1 Tax=Ornithinimicrobium cerasi TaxID=2248773 RepID=A0A285VUE4_9MICO|nr:Na+/H+ antiporter subunit E [Ornithinimicrobium cerasi]SOC56261.1 multicomponent Na+:H+ antiporter subunit E [Ornithinimicrobium cerasi]